MNCVNSYVSNSYASTHFGAERATILKELEPKLLELSKSP